MTLVARSSSECRLYLERHAHDCGEKAFQARSTLEKRGGDMYAIYEAACPKCGRLRRVEFLLHPEVPPPAPAYGGSKVSQIIDPGEFFLAADRAAKDAPDSLKGLSPERAAYARARLTEAVAAMDEVLKFIPKGADDIPASAFTSAAGKEIYRKTPTRFIRSRLEAIANTYREGLRDYDRELGADDPHDGKAAQEHEYKRELEHMERMSKIKPYNPDE
jgi:hypothetical protein